MGAATLPPLSASGSVLPSGDIYSSWKQCGKGAPHFVRVLLEQQCLQRDGFKMDITEEWKKDKRGSAKRLLVFSRRLYYLGDSRALLAAASSGDLAFEKRPSFKNQKSDPLTLYPSVQEGGGSKGPRPNAPPLESEPVTPFSVGK
ncbi:hypothetical protein D9611_001399 [Ephemerocybe angulata]|uniref:Uncharacterized protein n=1 Tax=Ephemerocybe angulata TaxID=980116 RepID=A0A8H5FM76_9AGAR|nr:hypothetical protein D9611_001399 [Tulosesus angulatus]